MAEMYGKWWASTFVLIGAIALSGCATSRQVGPPAQARAYAPAWIPIPDNPNIGSYAEIGSVELRIRDFYPRKLARDVYVQPRGGTKTKQPKQNFGNGKTLWDIDAQALCTGTARQKVRVNVVIDTDKSVYFQTLMAGGRQAPSIAAADAASAAAFSDATLPVESPSGIWTSSFWVLCEAAATNRDSKFNIAIEVRDAVESGYTLPLVVDPLIRNRG
jgi:hypothetical protein